MSKVYSIGQMNQVADALEAAGYTTDDVTKLRSKPDILKEFKFVLGGSAKIVRESFNLACDKAFSPTEFIGQGWTVWKGPVAGNGLIGQEDRDVREDDIMVIDWKQVLFEDHLQEKEFSIHGEEKLKRAIASCGIQLGGKAFLSLWEDYQANGKNSVLEKLRCNGFRCIYFFGLCLRSSIGNRSVLRLYANDYRWWWGDNWLSGRWSASRPSISLISN